MKQKKKEKRIRKKVYSVQIRVPCNKTEREKKSETLGWEEGRGVRWKIKKE